MPTGSPSASHYYQAKPAAARQPQAAALSLTASRNPAGACSTASTVATRSAHRGGEEVEAVATIAVTARAKVFACPRAWTATSRVDGTRDRLCLVVAVEEENVEAAGLVPGGKRADVAVAGEAREKMEDQARDQRRRLRSWTPRWRTTLEVTVVELPRTTMALRKSRMVVERHPEQLQRLPQLETTIST
jgi:hypothetical protein